MFNPLSAPEITLALGRVLKQAASAQDPQDEYQRSQLLSAHSIARHLAAEQSAGDELVVWLRQRVTSELRTAAEDRPPALTDLADHAERIGSCRDPGDLGAELSDLMGALRRSRSEAAGRLMDVIRGLLREMCDREVAALAAAPS